LAIIYDSVEFMIYRPYFKLVSVSISIFKKLFPLLLIVLFASTMLDLGDPEKKVAYAAETTVVPAKVNISTENSQIPMTFEWDRSKSGENAAEFAWKSFIALNSPAGENGRPLKDRIISQSPISPRVWECFSTPDDRTWQDKCGVAPKQRAAGNTSQVWEGRKPFVSKLSKKTARATVKKHTDSEIGLIPDKPLIDQQQNFIVYEIRVNKDEFTQIKAAQKQTGEFDFVASAPGANGEAAVSPIEIKAAWRVFDDRNSDAEKSSYYTTKKNVCIPGKYTETHQQLCEDLELGLIGFHLAQKFEWQKAAGKSWIWSSFEHVNNIALATKTQATPTLANPACPTQTCPSNQRPQGDLQWQTKSPHASQYTPVQVQRRVPIQSNVVKSNQTWHQNLARVNPKSVWQNYQLIGNNFTPINDQCKPADPDTCLSATNPSTKLLNVTMETYIEPSVFPNCASCHINAQNRAGSKSDFSFLFDLAAQ
jgi:hypothetical protein